MRKTKQ